MEEAGGVAARLLALLEQEAQTLVLEGRASVHVTTIAEQYKVDHEDADETVYALRPTRNDALPVCLLPAGAGWYLLPGDGPSLEFWAGTDTDLEETRAVLRAVLAVSTATHMTSASSDRSSLGGDPQGALGCAEAGLATRWSPSTGTHRRTPENHSKCKHCRIDHRPVTGRQARRHLFGRWSWSPRRL